MTTKRDKTTQTTATGEDLRKRERRDGERRTSTQPAAAERRRKGPGGERRKVERRINEYPLDAAVLEFINAVNDFKSVNQKPFPTWTEIFRILHDLGYRKVEE